MRTIIGIGALVGAVFLTATTGFAQGLESPRPYRGLFANADRNAAQSLTVSGSAGTGWDSNGATYLTAPVNGGLQVSPLQSARYGLFNGSATYSSYKDRLDFGASFATSARYYRSFADPFIASHSGHVGLGYRMGRATDFSVGETLSYQPFGSLDLFPRLAAAIPTAVIDSFSSVTDVASAPNLDLRSIQADYVSSQTNVSLTRHLSSRSDLTFGYGYHTSVYRGDDGTFHTQSASGRYSRGLTRNLSLRIGYGYSESRFVRDSKRFHNHNIDTGLDYGRALSISRRTVVGFTTGAVATSDGHTTHYSAVGGAQVTREIGRTWGLSAAYLRSVGFYEVLNQPLFQDAVSISFGGLASRRVQINSGVGASNASLGFEASGNRLWSYYGTAGIGVALSRHFSLGSGYNYYHYRLDDGVYRALGFAQQLNRHSVSVYISAWAPIFQKGQRPNASR